MQIHPEQVASETRVDDSSEVVQVLKANGAVKPKIVLVFDENPGDDKLKNPWKVRVFYNSPTPLQNADLSVNVVLMDTKIMPSGEDVIRTIYPDGYIGWCGVVGGTPVWIT